MAGFGRTGKLFGFCHAPSVVPDLITFAKGVNGAFLPLAGIGMRSHIAEHFRGSAAHMVGSTYHSHPVALASAYAALKVMLRDGLVERAAALGPVMSACMDDLLAKHPSVKQARNRGLFGAFDVQRNRTGTFIGA
jgi:taurine--2-oxoglutarate transaminase